MRKYLTFSYAFDKKMLLIPKNETIHLTNIL